MTFKSVIEWLFERRPEEMKPQIGGAREDKTAIFWMPGRRVASEAQIQSSAIRFLGATNRVYQTYEKPMQEQESWIVWAGLDVDGGDNPGFSVGEMARAVTIEEPRAAIRTSCGGKGLHVFLRLEKPIHCPVGYQYHSALTRSVSNPLVKALKEKHGVATCKNDSRMFWLWGGMNAWIRRPDEFIPTPSTAAGLASLAFEPTPGVNATRTFEGLHAHGAFVSGWLSKLGVTPGRVYVGSVVARLRALGETVETKSPCSGNGRTNGFIDVGPGWISLFAFADGCRIWSASEVDE